MQDSRVFLFAGHYGSGKTNIAVNFALHLQRAHAEKKVAIADLDIVNPYFRTKDSARELDRAGIRLICSDYANTNLDIPALPQETYRLVMQNDYYAVFDIGGDDRGALALGRYAPYILEENRYSMWFVVNFYRPLTQDADAALEVLREIEAAGGIPFSGIINNSNLGRETSAETVLLSQKKAEELAEKTNLPIVMTTVEETVAKTLNGTLPTLFPIRLQEKIF